MPGRQPFGRPLPLLAGAASDRGVPGWSCGVRALGVGRASGRILGSEYSCMLLGEGSKTTDSRAGVVPAPVSVPLVPVEGADIPDEAGSLGGVWGLRRWLAGAIPGDRDDKARLFGTVICLEEIAPCCSVRVVGSSAVFGRYTGRPTLRCVPATAWLWWWLASMITWASSATRGVNLLQLQQVGQDLLPPVSSSVRHGGLLALCLAAFGLL